MPRVAVLSFTRTAADPRVMRQIAALGPVADVISCGQGPSPVGVVAHHQIPSERQVIPKTLKGLTALTLGRTDWAYRNLPAAAAAVELLSGATFDLIIANDIHTLPAALEVAGGRPVIADLHEYAPRESEDDWRWRLTLQRFNTELCQRYLPQAAAVTTVSDSIAREYERVFGVQVSTITNAGPHRDPQPRPAHRPIRVAHTGVAAQNRRLEVMVEGFSGLANVELDLYLVAPASRSRFLDEMTALASGTSNVRVMEPVAMDRVPETLDAYDLGVHILAPTSFNNRYALPNKIFDFVQSGLGVIVGPSPEMARIVDRYAIGQVLEDFEAATLRRALAGLTAEAVSEWKESSCAASWDLSGESQAGSLVALALRLVG